MVKEGKNYQTSCPVDGTGLSKFTGQFQILSDNTQHPLICFFLIEWVFISFVLSWILIAVVNCTNLVFLVLSKYILLFQLFYLNFFHARIIFYGGVNRKNLTSCLFHFVSFEDWMIWPFISNFLSSRDQVTIIYFEYIYSIDDTCQIVGNIYNLEVLKACINESRRTVLHLYLRWLFMIRCDFYIVFF